jgi:Na+(H+)/acetate symporter ActP
VACAQVTWTQVAQYIVLIIAYVLPVVILSTQQYGLPIPQLTYGQVLQEIAAREQQLVQEGLIAAGALKPHTEPFFNLSPLNYFGLIFCLMVGTASLPHVLMRYFTTPSVREARKSVAWSLLFIFILYFTAPAYAAFAKLEVLPERHRADGGQSGGRSFAELAVHLGQYRPGEDLWRGRQLRPGGRRCLRRGGRSHGHRPPGRPDPRQ